jgi:hypothetical protein
MATVMSEHVTIKSPSESFQRECPTVFQKKLTNVAAAKTKLRKESALIMGISFFAICFCLSVMLASYVGLLGFEESRTGYEQALSSLLRFRWTMATLIKTTYSRGAKIMLARSAYRAHRAASAFHWRTSFSTV